MNDVIIIGGGLAGLINSILLSRAGLRVLLIERKQYPFHRVCGEYISHEVTPFLKGHGLFPEAFEPSQIRRFQLSAISGKTATIPLDLGGFGISRFALDHFLYKKALESGTLFELQQSVEDVTQTEEGFEVAYGKGNKALAKLVIGAFGKRSRLDKTLERPFMN